MIKRIGTLREEVTICAFRFLRQPSNGRPRRSGENKVLASQKPLRASPQGQHDEKANGDVIGNEHGIPTAQIAPNHLVSWGYSPPLSCLLWAGDYSESV
jgi:hypothetical protein